jgi:hypothetical protein
MVVLGDTYLLAVLMYCCCLCLLACITAVQLIDRCVATMCRAWCL